MKKILSKMHLRKADEMERHILLRARSIAYLYTAFALLLWSLYESYRVYLYHTPLNLVPCAILVTSALVQGFAQLVLQRNAVKGETEYVETRPLIRIVLLSAVLITLLASVTAFLLLAGVWR